MPSTEVRSNSETLSNPITMAAPPKNGPNPAEIIGKTSRLVISEQQMPTIDMAMLELEDLSSTGRKEMSEYMAKACETWGFFQLINHGLDASLLEKVREVSIGFFKKPEEEKLEYKIRLGVVEGFYSKSLTAVGSNKLTHSVDHLFFRSDPPSLTNYELWPLDPPAYRETMKEYTHQVRALAEKLIGILSEELGLKTTALQDRLEGGPAADPTVSFRTNYYSPVKKAPAADEEDEEEDKEEDEEEDTEDLCRLHAHSDPGGLTVLLQNGVAGFEVRKDELWVGVEPIAEALVVNVGDQIQILSNGRYKSIEHRGNAHRTKERLSIATFYSPAHEILIGPMDELVDNAYPSLYKSIRFRDYFSNFVVKGLNGKDYIRAAGVEVQE
ncbi:unnamed protein product [Calypogeia fissa]